MIASAVTTVSVSVGLWVILQEIGLLPMGLAGSKGLALALGLGIALSFTRFAVVPRVLFVGATLCVLIVGLSPLSAMITAWWPRRDPLTPPIQAVVVLSGGLKRDTLLNGPSADRLIAGFEIVRTMTAPLLLTTRVQAGSAGQRISSDADQERLVRLLASQAEWIRTPLVRTTRDEALESQRLLSPRGVHRIAVVTSPMHTRRACAVFEAVGFEVVCVPGLMRSGAGRMPDNPQERINAFGQWVYELAGMVKYRSRGWLRAPSATAH